LELAIDIFQRNFQRFLVADKLSNLEASIFYWFDVRILSLGGNVLDNIAVHWLTADCTKCSHR